MSAITEILDVMKNADENAQIVDKLSKECACVPKELHQSVIDERKSRLDEIADLKDRLKESQAQVQNTWSTKTHVLLSREELKTLKENIDYAYDDIDGMDNSVEDCISYANSVQDSISSSRCGIEDASSVIEDFIDRDVPVETIEEEGKDE